MTRLIDLLLYGNLWIAAAATALCWQSMVLLPGAEIDQVLLWVVFSATWLVYSIHRLRTSYPPSKEARLEKARVLRPMLRVFIVCSMLGLLFGLYHLPTNTALALLPPALLALGYVFPLFRGKRLRDLPYLKILFVSLTWTWVTVALPVYHHHLDWSSATGLLLLERVSFLFALSLLFDWRDRHHDRSLGIPSLPQRLQLGGTQSLGAVLVLVSLCSAVLNLLTGIYTASNLLAIALSLGAVLLLLWQLPYLRHDYSYSGLADGVIILQAILVGGLHLL